MNEVEVAQQEIKTFAGKVPAAITTPSQLVEAEGMFVSIRKERKKWEKFFNDKFIDPAKKLLKSHQDEAKTTLQPLVDAETMLTKATTEYRKIERERIAKEQAKLNAKHDKKKDKAIEKGKDPDEVEPPPLLAQQEKSTDTGEGKLTYRTVKDVVCVDESLTPDQYCKIVKTPNKVMIRAALLGGQEVPGWTLFEREELAIRG